MFRYTYGEYTKSNPGIQMFFTPPPQCSRRGDGGFTSFVYIFGKGEEGRGRYSGGLDTPFFHTPYYVLFIPHTIH
jgi:hypothetical protein